MPAATFYWHDYETFGTNPQYDRPVQFAGVRTDESFNPVGEPLVVYLKPSDDYLPDPDACLITGITPQIADQKGLNEAEFSQMILNEISAPNTCTLGYNNLRFDDEFTRNLLYRNFYDPYAREWQNGNSRWDMIDIVRATRALRPGGINWPLNQEGLPSIRLEHLAEANDIAHHSAHDALSDVYATIGVAKLIQRCQPRLFQFLRTHRFKSAAFDLLKLGSFEPLLHVSGRYPTIKNCLAVILPLCIHPLNNNGIIVYDLSVDPEPLMTLSADEISRRLYTPSQQLPDGIDRIPLKTVHVNKCPVLAPLSVIRPDDAERLELDLAICQINKEKIIAVKGLADKLTKVFANSSRSESESDPDEMIYSGGFFSDLDKKTMAEIRALTPEELAKARFKFSDWRLPEMLFRYRARNYPDTLSEAEKKTWREFCFRRLTEHPAGTGMTLEKYFGKIEELKNASNLDPLILERLGDYGRQKMQQLSLAQMEA